MWGSLIGMFSNALSGYRENLEAENLSAQQSYMDIQSKIEGLPTYEISPEAEQRLKLLQEAGVGLTETAEEATDIARMRAGAAEAPGAGIAREDIRQSTAGQIQAIQEMGGGASALGAVSEVGLTEQKALRDLARTTLAYRSQAESDLMSAVRSEAGIKAQAAGLEAQGLEGMIAEKDKVYQSELDKALTGVQFDITRLAMEQQAIMAQQQNQAGMQSDIFSVIAQLGSAWMQSKK